MKIQSRKKTHLWVENIIEANGETTAGVTIENHKHKRQILWYRLPAKYSAMLTKSCDPFVLGTLFTAMNRSTDLHVHGEVSPLLLQNLEEFQKIWRCWLPERYTKIDIIADVEREQPKADNPDSAIAAFSGGVDSCFTVWRHHTGSCGRLSRSLQAGVMVHGFDIPLKENDAFERAAERSKKMLQNLRMEFIPIATNFRQLVNHWEDAHGAAVASVLMMLQGGYRAGLIASSAPYYRLILPWGSNPVTDGLMSSDAFHIIHDGAAFTRSEKVREISNWTEARQYLRVCHQKKQSGPNCGQGHNCGVCAKCIRTILNFRVNGLELPGCFEHDVSDNQILSLKKLGRFDKPCLNDILSTAKAARIPESWVAALEKCIEQNRHATSSSQNIWQRIGTTIGVLRCL
jgi:predicted PP-loop superfamily ATPase